MSIGRAREAREHRRPTHTMEGRNDRVVGDRGRLDHGAGRAGVKGRPRSFVKTASHILPAMRDAFFSLLFFGGRSIARAILLA